MAACAAICTATPVARLPAHRPAHRGAAAAAAWRRGAPTRRAPRQQQVTVCIAEAQRSMDLQYQAKVKYK